MRGKVINIWGFSDSFIFIFYCSPSFFPFLVPLGEKEILFFGVKPHVDIPFGKVLL